MATSQNPTFISTKNDIIRDAYAILNIHGADESINASDYELASRFLNRMIKSWMAQGYHLWLKQTAYLFPQKQQVLYRISSSSSDNSTLTYYETTLTDNASTGDDFVIVDDISNISTSDYLGILLNNNELFWTTVDTIGLGNQLNFPSGITLPSDASSGRKVFSYTNKLDNPLNIYSAVRSSEGRDIPMNYLSYEEYFQLPNKETSLSTPVSYNYDKQLDEAVIRIWPSPSSADLIIKFTLSRKIYNFDVNSNEPDFPMEWHRAIIYNLAVSIAPAFGKNKDTGFQMLIQQAAIYLNEAAAFDNELGSIYVKPNFRR